jgi:hypothetical protein
LRRVGARAAASDEALPCTGLTDVLVIEEFEVVE